MSIGCNSDFLATPFRAFDEWKLRFAMFPFASSLKRASSQELKLLMMDRPTVDDNGVESTTAAGTSSSRH